MTIIDILHDSRLTTQPVAGKLRECEYNSMYTLRKEKNRLLSTQQYVCNSHLTPCLSITFLHGTITVIIKIYMFLFPLLQLGLLEDYYLCELFKISERRLRNFTVGLTDTRPGKNNYPLKAPFLLCATHGKVGARGCNKTSRLTGASVTLPCDTPMYAWGRYLFVEARVDRYFHLAEVEVFDGTLAPLLIFRVNTDNTITGTMADAILITCHMQLKILTTRNVCCNQSYMRFEEL